MARFDAELLGQRALSQVQSFSASFQEFPRVSRAFHAEFARDLHLGKGLTLSATGYNSTTTLTRPSIWVLSHNTTLMAGASSDHGNALPWAAPPTKTQACFVKSRRMVRSGIDSSDAFMRSPQYWSGAAPTRAGVMPVRREPEAVFQRAGCVLFLAEHPADDGFN